MNPLVFVFKGLGGIVSGLGLAGTFVAIVSLILLGLAAKFADRALSLLERWQRIWRRWPIWARQIFVVLVGVMTVPPLLATVPMSVGSFAVFAGLGTYWWGMGLKHARRYGLVDTTAWKAWNHHWRVSTDARKLTKAVADGTGKPGGKARRPKLKADGQEAIIEPPHGQSASDFAMAVNRGELHSAVAQRYGWGQVKGMKATPLPDGTVLVHLDRLGAEGGDPLAESRWWTP